MKLDALKIIVGAAPLPSGTMDQIAIIKYCDANHVLGQMAHHYHGPVSEGLADVFQNAKLRAAHDHMMLTFEMDRISRAIAGAGIRAVVLKGGAYVALGLDAAAGRRVSDLDILVSEGDLEKTEALLLDAGWQRDEPTDNPYDQQYYREYMHELPPLRHKTRGTIVDVHHALLPKTARYAIATQKLVNAARDTEVAGLSCFAPLDVFIHSAVHAFADGAVDAPVRTLVELYFLFNELDDGVREQLVERSRDLGAKMPVAVALWALGNLFDVSSAAKLSPELAPAYRHLMLKWALRAKTAGGPGVVPAKLFLYIRSHYLRMPVYLLLPHLVRKALRWRPGQNLPTELPTP